MAQKLTGKPRGLPVTPISDIFIEYYMPKANPIFVSIYILVYKRLTHGEDVNTKELSEVFNILESDVVNALKYWESIGLMKLGEESDTLQISFSDLQDISDDDPLQAKPKGELKDAVKRRITPETRPNYSVQELEVYKASSAEISDLFEFAEKTLGKMLRYNDLNLLFGFYDWLRLPLDVIKLLLANCGENGHRSMNYIETVALDWAEKGIKSVEQAEDYIQAFNKDYRGILKAFGVTGRNPTPKEIEFMEKWLRDWHMPMDIVLEACDKTMAGAGKINLKYTDTILNNWYECGVKTVDDIKQNDVEFTEKKPKKASASTVKRNRFVNFEGRKIDFDEVEKLEREYIENIVKGQ